MNKFFFIVFLFTCHIGAHTIQGFLKQSKNVELLLKGHDGFNEKVLAKNFTDSLGNFVLDYPSNYVGMAVLKIGNTTEVNLILNREDFSLVWDDLQDLTSLSFFNSPENIAFEKGFLLYQASENKLRALNYLVLQYKQFSKEQKWLKNEIIKQENLFPRFLEQLPSESYIRYYLKLQKTISELTPSSSNYSKKISKYEDYLKNIDFKDDKLWTSGLVSNLLNVFYQSAESSIDDVITHSNTISDILMNNLQSNPVRMEEVAVNCFKILEKRSLYDSAKYIAFKMLNQSNYKLSESNTNVFSQYIKLAKGEIAPDIDLKGIKLSGLPNRNKLLVFGASWCPQCQLDYLKLLETYVEFKDSRDLEIIYISIDTEKKGYDDFYSKCPFITFCDMKGWETQSVKDYHVFATPTYFLLDKNLKIIAKPQAVDQIKAWLKKDL